MPQLNANSSSIELLDVEQIEFVRGPQSALFGRNTLGGLVNVTSSRPSMTGWTGSLSLPFGNHGAWTVRGGVSGPLVAGQARASASRSPRSSRDGFTVNDITGNDIDSRSAFSGKGQVLWTPATNWEARVIVTGERARDGDYALNDVAALRANPFHAARDFEGRADRDIFGTTIQSGAPAGRCVISSTTGIVSWKTQDVTDLDYTPLPLIPRDNTEEATASSRRSSASRRPSRRRSSCPTTPRCAGRRACSCSRRTTSRTRSTPTRRSCVAPLPGQSSTRRARRSTTSASACSARRR